MSEGDARPYLVYVVGVLSNFRPIIFRGQKTQKNVIQTPFKPYKWIKHTRKYYQGLLNYQN